jgi:hypothetical protein
VKRLAVVLALTAVYALAPDAGAACNASKRTALLQTADFAVDRTPPPLVRLDRLVLRELEAKLRAMPSQKPRRMTGECCDTYGCTTCSPPSAYCDCEDQREECQCQCALLPVGQQAQCFQMCYEAAQCCYNPPWWC